MAARYQPPALVEALQRIRQDMRHPTDVYGFQFCLIRMIDLNEVVGALDAYEKTMAAIEALPTGGLATPALCDHFEDQCNRFVNGTCTTVRCVRRGRDRDPGRAPLLDAAQLSTCEAFEAAHIIADLTGRRYGSDYDIGEARREAAHEAAKFRP